MTPEQLQTVSKVQKHLDKIPYPDSYRIAREIVSHYNNTIPEIENALKRLSSNEPWEYIKEEAEFMGRGFKVTRETLIPRLETEELVTHITKTVDTYPNIDKIIDVGTGSGAIIATVALNIERKSISFVGTDINPETLRIAQYNLENLNLEKNVELKLTNLLEEVEITENTLIVANLPYIPTSDYNQLDSSVKDYEPERALEGGEDGMKYIKELIEQIKTSPHKPLAIYLEIDPTQAPYLLKEMSQLGGVLYKTESIKDFKDNIRFVSAIKIT